MKYCKIVCDPYLILQCIKAFKYELKESVKVIRAWRGDKDIGVTAQEKIKQELNSFSKKMYINIPSRIFSLYEGLILPNNQNTPDSFRHISTDVRLFLFLKTDVFLLLRNRKN